MWSDPNSERNILAVRTAEKICGFESNIEYTCCGLPRYGTTKFVIAELISQSLQFQAQEMLCEHRLMSQAGRVREVVCA